MQSKTQPFPTQEACQAGLITALDQVAENEFLQAVIEKDVIRVSGGCLQRSGVKPKPEDFVHRFGPDKFRPKLNGI